MTPAHSQLDAVRDIPQHATRYQSAVALVRRAGRHDIAAWRMEVEAVLAQAQLRTAHRSVTPPMLRALLVHGIWSSDDLRAFVGACDAGGSAAVVVGELADLLPLHDPWCLEAVEGEPEHRYVAHALMRLVPMALARGATEVARRAVSHWIDRGARAAAGRESSWLLALLRTAARGQLNYSPWEPRNLPLPPLDGMVLAWSPGHGPETRQASARDGASEPLEAAIDGLHAAIAGPTPLAAGRHGWQRAVLRHERAIRHITASIVGDTLHAVLQRVDVATASRLPGHRRRLLAGAMDELRACFPTASAWEVRDCLAVHPPANAEVEWLLRAGFVGAQVPRRAPVPRAIALEPAFARAFADWALAALRSSDPARRGETIRRLGECLTDRDDLLALADLSLQIEGVRAWPFDWTHKQLHDRAGALGGVVTRLSPADLGSALERYLQAPPWTWHVHLMALLGLAERAGPEALAWGRQYLHDVVVGTPGLGPFASVAARWLAPGDLLAIVEHAHSRSLPALVRSLMDALLGAPDLTTWDDTAFATLASHAHGDAMFAIRLALHQLMRQGVSPGGLFAVLVDCRSGSNDHGTRSPLAGCLARMDARALTELLGRAVQLPADGQSLLVRVLLDFESLPSAAARAAWHFLASRLDASHAWGSFPPALCQWAVADTGFLARAEPAALAPLIACLRQVDAMHDVRRFQAALCEALLARWLRLGEHELLLEACSLPGFAAALGKRVDLVPIVAELLGENPPDGAHEMLDALLPFVAPGIVERFMRREAALPGSLGGGPGTPALWVRGCRQAYLDGRRDEVFAWLEARLANANRRLGTSNFGIAVLEGFVAALLPVDVPRWTTLYREALFSHPVMVPGRGPEGLVRRGFELGLAFPVVVGWLAGLPVAQAVQSFASVIPSLTQANLLALWDWLLELDDRPQQVSDARQPTPFVDGIAALGPRLPELPAQHAGARLRRTLDRGACLDWLDAIGLLIALVPLASQLHGCDGGRVVAEALRKRLAATVIATPSG